MSLLDMPNVGPVLAGNLNAVGIQTPEQLSELGCKDAFVRIRETVDPGACLHMLYALHGAIEGIPDGRLSDAAKEDLRRFYHNLQV